MKPTSTKRQERRVSCGPRTLRVELEVDKQIRVRSSVSPRPNGSWAATVMQERRLVFQGMARRGEIDKKLTNLPGADHIRVRLTSDTGAVCVAELTVTA